MFIPQNKTLTNAHHDHFMDKHYQENGEVSDAVENTAVSTHLSLRDKALLKSGSLFIALGKGLQKHSRPAPRHPQLAK